MAFTDEPDGMDAFEDMASRWPNAHYVEDVEATAAYAERIFDPKRWDPKAPLRVVLIGSDFQVRVWEALLRIPMGCRHLFVHRRKARPADRLARGGRGGRPQSHLLRRALPPRARQERCADRLSLGPHAQARDARMGGRTGARGITRASTHSIITPRSHGSFVAFCVVGNLRRMEPTASHRNEHHPT